MKLLLDMNISPLLVQKLAEAGIEAMHWFSIGAPNAKDKELLNYAREMDFVLMSSDLEFSAVLANTQETKPSIIQLRMQGIKIERDAPIIIAAVNQCVEELEKGAILTIDVSRRRLRLLPLPG